MTTSGVYSLTVTRDDIIRQAMLNIRRLDPDEAPSASETRDCSFVLNMMVKQWQGKTDFAPGLKVWTRKHGHLFLSDSAGAYTVGSSATGWTNTYTSALTTASAAQGATAIVVDSAGSAATGWYVGIVVGTNTLQWTTVASVAGTTININAALSAAVSVGAQVFLYQTIAQNPLHIETAVLRDQDLSDTPLRIMTIQSYDYLPNKADPTYSGDPSAIYFENGRTSSTIYTDVGSAQDVTKHIVMSYLEPVQVFVNPTDEVYYPEEWFLALSWGLSEQIAPMFRATWGEKDEQLKNSALAIARNKGAEVSDLYFQPGAED